MVELPLFPLNTVLFPGMPLKLHIFEPRYRQMIGECIENDEPFGVVLIKKGQEALGPLATPYGVGTTADIIEVERLEDKKLNIGTIGRERFRILQADDSGVYLTGRVETLSLKNTASETLLEVSYRLRKWMENYANLLTQTSNIVFLHSDMPDDPIEIAYMGASWLRTPDTEKQMLLEIGDAEMLAKRVEELYRRETALMKAIIRGEAGGARGLGKN